jgi:hypothetical protein
MTDTPDEIARLRKIAEAATPGEWHPDKYGGYVWGPEGEMIADQGDHAALRPGAIVRMRGVGGGLPIAQNRAHICAFSPATALRLLNKLEQFREALETLVMQRDAHFHTAAAWDAARAALAQQEPQP